jgi:hypothetical protein
MKKKLVVDKDKFDTVSAKPLKMKPMPMKDTKTQGGVRAKYAARYRRGTNLVLLSPDVATFFPDEKSVNAALRTLIRSAKAPTKGLR